MLAFVASLALATPAAAVIEVPSGTSARLEWAPAEGAVAAYFVYQIKPGGSLQIYCIRPASEPWTVLQGADGVEYALQVTAIDENGEFGPPSEPSEYIRFVALEDAPPQEPPVEEPPIEKASVEEPPVEKPPVEEPPTEEPPADGAPPHVANRNASLPLDFDGDGASDLLFRHDGTGELSIWYVESELPVVEAVDMLALSDAEDVVGNADYDGNGTADIAVHNASTGELRVHFLEAGSQIGMLAFDGVMTDIVGSGDFNADGAADLVLFDGATGEVEAWPDLYSASSEEIIPIKQINNVVDFLAVGDFDGNGLPDLLVRKTESIRAHLDAGGDYDKAKVLKIPLNTHFGGFCHVKKDAVLGAVTYSDGKWSAYDLKRRKIRLRRGMGDYDAAAILGAGDHTGDGGCDLLIEDTDDAELLLGRLTRKRFRSHSIGVPETGWRSVGVGYGAP